ncbi:MAG: hypothetical protein GF355_01485 [Candidatus Eisenbacteria bacterium]|nr:hypothetical protein [Candidatus Eisenbacteria bacterium]
MARLQWYGGEKEILSLQAELRRFLSRSGALSSLLMDTAGRLLTMVGTVVPQFDITSFVSLTASDFAANQELARLLGEESFHDLYHQGDVHGVYISHLPGGMLVAVLFDRTTTLGLVRHALKKTKPRLEPLLAEALRPRPATAGDLDGDRLDRIADDIDRLFD